MIKVCQIWNLSTCYCGLCFSPILALFNYRINLLYPNYVYKMSHHDLTPTNKNCTFYSFASIRNNAVWLVSEMYNLHWHENHILFVLLTKLIDWMWSLISMLVINQQFNEYQNFMDVMQLWCMLLSYGFNNHIIIEKWQWIWIFPENHLLFS